ncbi:chromatin associated protein [Favolaschia claudopus]|uniref:Chromatin associated protein n=1 Tax=Favolaschia claudopus TaxID=2862362 RepID=A0AAW0D1I5_9AGAR
MAQHRPAPVPTALGNALDAIKAEFDLLASEVAIARRERDECEATLASQVNELNLIRQSLYELESLHGKLRHQYEEDLARLRAELHAVRQGAGPPHRPLPPQPSTSMLDIRDRERDPRERVPDRDRMPDRISEREPPRDRERLPERERGPDRDRDRERDSQRERDRERDRERERDTKRHKADRSRPIAPQPVPPAPMKPATPISSVAFLDDLDLPNMPPHLKKECPASPRSGTEWFAVWNPAVKHKRIADVNLMHTLLHESVVCCVRFSKDGRFLATGCNRTAQVYDARSGAKICSLIDPNVPKGGDLYIRSVCFSPDGSLLATGAEDTQIRIWEIAKKRIIAILSGHQQEIYALDFSADGRFVVSGSGDKTVRIWDMRGISSASSASSSGTSIAPSPPCQVLTITDIAPPPSPSMQMHRTSPAPTPDGGITSVAISPNGARVAAGSLDALVRVWDVRTGTLVRRLKGHGDSVYSVAFMPEVGPHGHVHGMAPRGMGLVSGGLDRTVRGWDLGLSEPGGGVLQGWKEPVAGPALQGWKEAGSGPSSSGASGGAGKGWKEGDEEGRCTMTFLGHKDYVLSVAVSHDGEWVVSGSKDRGVQFWDAKTGIAQCMLQGHKNSVISIDLSPAGNVLATGSGDWHARIWSYDVVS